MRLIRWDILAVEQIAPYALLEIKRSDLDSELVTSIIKRLKITGKRILEGETLADCGEMDLPQQGAKRSRIAR